MNIFNIRTMFMIFAILIFMLYQYVVDPGTSLFFDDMLNPNFLFSVQFIITASVGVVLALIIYDIENSNRTVAERELRAKAKETADGAGLALIAKAIGFLGVAIIIAAVYIGIALSDTVNYTPIPQYIGSDNLASNTVFADGIIYASDTKYVLRDRGYV